MKSRMVGVEKKRAAEEKLRKEAESNRSLAFLKNLLAVYKCPLGGA